MFVQACVAELERTPAVLGALVAGLQREAATWRPAPAKWSILDVLGHLLDEERDDFRKRLTLTLADPEAVWPPIDPEAWAREREYNARDLDTALAAFAGERRESVRWLRGLGQPDLEAAHAHPTLGPVRAGDLLAAWVAHDHLHVRQIVNLRLSHLAIAAAPYSPRYALP